MVAEGRGHQVVLFDKVSLCTKRSDSHLQHMNEHFVECIKGLCLGLMVVYEQASKALHLDDPKCKNHQRRKQSLRGYADNPQHMPITAFAAVASPQ